MDEYLFITMAKLKADRLRLEREQRAREPAEESRKQPIENSRPVEATAMKTTVTFAASVVINVLALAVLTWSVSETHLTPAGEVTITQLEE